MNFFDTSNMKYVKEINISAQFIVPEYKLCESHKTGPVKI